MSSPTMAAPAPIAGVAAKLRRARDTVLGIRTAYVLVACVIIQWIAALALALSVHHNGWLYYAGGDQLWHYSGSYLIAHGHLPPAFVSYGWSFLLLPVSAFAGPNLVSALPALVLFDTLVLLPVAVLCVYGIAARIGGKLFGYWAAALWIGLPYLGILVVEPGYHQKYTELTLPQFVGLTSVPDFPGTVALLVAAYFCLRAVESSSWHAAAAAGLATGYSIALKPSNSIFLAAPVLMLIVLKWRDLVPFGAALAPMLLTLALWKFRGLGELAATPAEPIRVASASDLLHRIHNTGKLNSWEHLHQVLLGLREHFWASRVIEWLPLGGMVALLIRSRRAFLLVGIWFIAFILAKGTYIPASIDDASFFRILMPALPAYLLLAASVVLLAPGLRAQPGGGTFPLAGRRLTVALAVAVAVFVVAPLAVVAAVPQLHDQGRLGVRQGNTLVPVSAGIAPRATLTGSMVVVSWRHQSAGASGLFYRILRTNSQNGGLACAGTLRHASDDCRLYLDTVGTTRASSYVDRPGKGTWTYRIGVSANWLNDVRYGDVYVVSPPVTATIP